MEAFIRQLRQSSPSEKIVIVSNFTSPLDLLSSMAANNQWKTYRVDGQVPTDKRQLFIDSFNRDSDEFSIFLLSSKAGGVGINL